MDTLTALRNTSKGKLKYDNFWYRDGGLEEILSECTSPPSVPPTPKSVSLGTTPERQLPITGLSFTEAEVKENRRRSLGNVPTSAWKDIENGTKSPQFLKNLKKEEKNKWNQEQISEQEEILVPEITPVDISIKHYDEHLENGVRKSLVERRKLFQQTSHYLGQQAETALIELYVRKDREAQRGLARAVAEQEAQSLEAERFEQQCKEKLKQHARLLDSKLREAQERKKQQEEEEETRRLKESIERLEALMKIQVEVKTICTNSLQLINTCQYSQYLQDNARKAAQELAHVVGKMERMVKLAQEKGTQIENIQEALELVRTARHYHDIIEKAAEAATKQGRSEAEAAQRAASAQNTAPTAAQQVPTNGTPGSSVSSKEASTVKPKSDEILCINEKALIEYLRLQSQLQSVQDSFQQFTADPNAKKQRFDLQKAVNTPVNAIAPTSGSHLRDKLQRLVQLLQGGQVEVGGKRVSANDHPAGRPFVKDLFAQKVVKQGEQQVASNFESAFAIAAVTVGVWCEMPDVGELILAHFHIKCPYTVPYYVPKNDGQSAEDYYKSLGYLYIDGTVEAQDKFLQRMSGYMRLYGSILISTPPRGPTHPHPHGLDHAWQWLAQTLNLHPRPDITATMVYDLLQVTGYGLLAVYKKQFVKMLQVLCTHYLPKIKQVTPAGSGGPVVRLENFLKKCISSNAVPKPDGMLAPNFWSTS